MEWNEPTIHQHNIKILMKDKKLGKKVSGDSILVLLNCGVWFQLKLNLLLYQHSKKK